MSKHHNLDVHPKPENVLYINETAIADSTAVQNSDQEQSDNIRVFVPLDLNHEAIMRRMKLIGERNGDPTEKNEFCYSLSVREVISQLEIYDQVWYDRERNYSGSPDDKHHSQHGKKLVEAMLDILEQWEENSSAECFPIDVIDELEEEYEIVREHYWK